GDVRLFPGRPLGFRVRRLRLRARRLDRQQAARDRLRRRDRGPHQFRRGWPTTLFRPHNLPFVMLGAGLLWFGWYGFNAGSATSSNGVAGTTFMTTTVATATAMLGWMLTERIRDGKATTLGAASGIVAGLVAITPSCSSVNVVGALVVGLSAGVLCALAVGLKYKLGYDDSLDVVGVHMVGGLVGTLLVGLVAAPEAPAAVTGLFYGGGFDQLWRQAVGA